MGPVIQSKIKAEVVGKEHLFHTNEQAKQMHRHVLEPLSIHVSFCYNR
jgi:hypothetical protein